MLKKILITSCFLIIFAGSAFLTWKLFPVWQNQNFSLEKMPTISGIMLDGTIDTVIIQTESNSIYQFSRNNQTKINNPNGLTVGDQLTITYIGTLANDPMSQSIIVNDLVN